MTAQTESKEEEPIRWTDDATVTNGTHKQLADMAVVLSDAGKRVVIGNDSTNLTKELEPGVDYTVEHYENESIIRDPRKHEMDEHVTEGADLYINEYNS